MAANTNPTRISAPMWRFWQEFLAYEPQVRLGGIYVNKAGYHDYRDGLPKDDYSVEEVAADRKGPGDYASGIDLTMNDADMVRYSKRLDAAMRRRDPRLFINGQPVLREFIGTLDNKTVYCYMLTGGKAQGVGADSGVDKGRDKSHLWHIHISFIRQFCDTWRAYSGVLSILKDEPLNKWEFTLMALSAADVNAIWDEEVTLSDGRASTMRTIMRWRDASDLDTRKQILDAIKALDAKVDALSAKLDAIQTDVDSLPEATADTVWANETRTLTE